MLQFADVRIVFFLQGVELNLPEKDKLLQMEGDGHFFPQAEFPHFFNEPYFWKVKAEKQFHEGQNSDDEESDPHKLMKRLEEVRKAQLESKIEVGIPSAADRAPFLSHVWLSQQSAIILQLRKSFMQSLILWCAVG